MDHVVDSGATLRGFVAGAQIQPYVRWFHFGASFDGADAVEGNDEKIYLNDELAHVLIQPQIFANPLRYFTNVCYAGGVASCGGKKLLEKI